MAKIFIVDDHKWVRDVLTEALVEEGHLVDGTGEPRSTRELVARWKPDLVLLDLYLAHSDRWDILREIKRWNPTLPVVIVTGYEGYRSDPRISQADGFVIKSIDLREITRTVAEVLQNGGILLQGVVPHSGPGRFLYPTVAVDDLRSLKMGARSDSMMQGNRQGCEEVWPSGCYGHPPSRS